MGKTSLVKKGVATLIGASLVTTSVSPILAETTSNVVDNASGGV